MKLREVLMALALLLTSSAMKLAGQPYYYYSLPTSTKDGSDIFKVDLATGRDELILAATGQIDKLSWNQDQSWLYVSTKRGFEVVETNSLQRS